MDSTEIEAFRDWRDLQLRTGAPTFGDGESDHETDEIRDFDAAAQCRIPFVGVSWGVAIAEALVGAGAHRIVKSWSELAGVLESMTPGVEGHIGE